MLPKTRIMYIEYKGDGIAGPARIGRVTLSKSGKSVHYRGRTFNTLRGYGFKANYFDTETREHYGSRAARKMAATRSIQQPWKLTMTSATNIGPPFVSGLT